MLRQTSNLAEFYQDLIAAQNTPKPPQGFFSEELNIKPGQLHVISGKKESKVSEFMLSMFYQDIAAGREALYLTLRQRREEALTNLISIITKASADSLYKKQVSADLKSPAVKKNVQLLEDFSNLQIFGSDDHIHYLSNIEEIIKTIFPFGSKDFTVYLDAFYLLQFREIHDGVYDVNHLKDHAANKLLRIACDLNCTIHVLAPLLKTAEGTKSLRITELKAPVALYQNAAAITGIEAEGGKDGAPIQYFWQSIYRNGNEPAFRYPLMFDGKLNYFRGINRAFSSDNKPKPISRPKVRQLPYGTVAMSSPPLFDEDDRDDICF